MESTYNLSGAAKGMTGLGMNGGSEFRLGGSEDLGNGLKAEFSYAFVGNHNNATALANYNSFVGVAGDFGSVKIGRLFTPLALATWGNDAMGGAFVSGNLANGSGTQPNNTITYSSPSIAGVSLSVQGNNETSQSTGYSLTYSAGAFSAAYASNTTGTDKAINGIGASYDFGMAKLFLNSLTQSGADTATGYGVSVPMGAATLIASGSSKGTDDNYTLVAKYNLSKRTMAYFQNASASKAITNSIGISHAF
jgi:predicted porin